MREDGGHLASRNAVLLGVGHVVLEGRVGHSLGDERGHGEDGAHLQGKVVAAPHLAEQHIVVQGGELGREGAERVAAGGLDYFGHEVPRFFWGVSDATAHCAPSSFAHLISRYPKPSSKLKVKAQLRERRSFCRSLNPPVLHEIDGYERLVLARRSSAQKALGKTPGQQIVCDTALSNPYSVSASRRS